MRLFKNPNIVDRKLDHLTRRRIELTIIPDNLRKIPRYLQDSLAEFMSTFYKGEIEPLEREIKLLFDKNREFLLNKTKNVESCDYGDTMYEIFDTYIFVKNVREGKFPDSANSYVDLKRSDLVCITYLQYYWYYDNVLSHKGNYSYEADYYWYNYIEFNGLELIIKYPSLDEQLKIVKEMKSTHTEILQLQEKKRKAEEVLRKVSKILV